MSAVLGSTSLQMPDQQAIDRLDAAHGIVHVADLEWPLLDPEQPMKLIEYASLIGKSISPHPRENSVTDSALQLYRNDFVQAGVSNLTRGLFIPHAGLMKAVVSIREWRDGLKRDDYPGLEPFTTGVAVSEFVYEEIVKNATSFANQIDNKTQKKRTGTMKVEQVADLGGESAVYGLAEKHMVMEARIQYISKRTSVLEAVYRSVVEERTHRIGSMEPFRLDSLSTIMEIVRIACKQLGYGDNQTHDTLRATASNTHRTPDPAKWWKAYTLMAIRYNNEVQGKLAQSIHACYEEIGKHREQLINCEDRIYQDDQCSTAYPQEEQIV